MSDSSDTKLLARVGNFVMFYDLDAELWFKCKVIGETENYVQISYCGWDNRYEKPWIDKDTDRIEPMKNEKGKWKPEKEILGAWRRIKLGNEPESVKEFREMEERLTAEDPN
ncbi:hypothetical protein BSKO_13822 [Bryopsis sp. KO-2023]|nr:hypothetical protein BSKO_13822 [Bryopsis sp. KO-2023]